MNRQDNPLNQRPDEHEGHRNTNPYGSASGDGNGGNEQGGGYGDDKLARQYGTVLPAEPASSAGGDYSARGAIGNDRSYAADSSAPVSRGDVEDAGYDDRTGQSKPAKP